MPSDLSHPLGYLAAKRVLQVGRGAFFQSQALDLPIRASTLLAADDLIPQFGYVGANFHPLRILLLGINPGNGPVNAKSRSPGDIQMMPAHYRFFEVGSPQSFREAQSAYKGVCQSWAVWGRHCAELLTNNHLSIDQIAYSNCLPWRTASQSAFDESIAERAAQLYAVPLIEELKPKIIVAVGKKAAKILGYANTAMPPTVVWNRAQALTEAVGRERQAAAAQFRELLEAHRREIAS